MGSKVSLISRNFLSGFDVRNLRTATRHVILTCLLYLFIVFLSLVVDYKRKAPQGVISYAIGAGRNTQSTIVHLLLQSILRVAVYFLVTISNAIQTSFVFPFFSFILCRGRKVSYSVGDRLPKKAIYLLKGWYKNCLWLTRQLTLTLIICEIWTLLHVSLWTSSLIHTVPYTFHIIDN